MSNLGKRIVLPVKEYEQELKEEESTPGLLYDYNRMTAWYAIPSFRLTVPPVSVFSFFITLCSPSAHRIFHPVKRMKLKENVRNGAGDRPAFDVADAGSEPSGGATANGRLLNGGLMVCLWALLCFAVASLVFSGDAHV